MLVYVCVYVVSGTSLLVKPYIQKYPWENVFFPRGPFFLYLRYDDVVLAWNSIFLISGRVFKLFRFFFIYNILETIPHS